MKARIPDFPESSELEPLMREELDPRLKAAGQGISEFTFANLYLFRAVHNYRVSTLDGGVLITGNDSGNTFFMRPGALPGAEDLKRLFGFFSFMKCAAAGQARALEAMGYKAEEDRDNFDYVYSREDLSRLSGRKFHRKKNLVNLFEGTYTYEAKPLLTEYLPDAMKVLEEWRSDAPSEGDYLAAREALLKCDELALCGGIYYVEGAPAAFTLGEELKPDTFVVHFEKGLGRYKGLLQFVNRSFSAILPEKYVYINREQDLGDPGLRKSKESWRPVGFVKKFKIFL